MSRTHLVTPVGWLSRGEAFVPGDGQQLAVFGGIPGEAATVRIFSRTNHQVRARVLDVPEPARERVTPPCPKWGPCGGCPWMHLSPAGRQQGLAELLGDALRAERIDFVPEPADVADAPGSALVLEVVAGRSDQGHVRVGVPARDGPGIVAIPECLRVDERLRPVMSAIVGAMARTKTWPFDGQRGTVAGASIRAVPGTEYTFVTLDLTRPTGSLAELALAMVSMRPELRAVAARMDGETKKVLGAESVEGTWLGLRVPFAVDDRLPEARRSELPDLSLPDDLGVAPGDTVLDLTGGNRARTVLLAQRSGWALGLELTLDGAARGQKIATANRVAAEFAVGEEGLAESGTRLAGRRPLLHVDLGHRDLRPSLREALRASDPRRVALTGDNPKAVAREIAAWQADGWRLERLRTWEVLPWTPFVAHRAVLVSPDDRAADRRAPRRRTVRG